MKKYLALTALALIMASPAKAEGVNDTNIKRTMTAVERAAIQQGFIKLKPGEDSALMTDGVTMSPAMTSTPPSLMQEAPAPMLAPTQKARPSVFSGNHSVMMMAPKPLPEDAAVVPVTTNAARPSLVTKELPYGLVMDGPGTEAYKKKKRRQKKAEEARKADPAPVAAPVTKRPTPAPAVVQEPVKHEAPVAMPDHNSLPPADEPMPDMGMEMDAPGDLAPPDDPFGDFGQ